jgi:hypothetical protein
VIICKGHGGAIHTLFIIAHKNKWRAERTRELPRSPGRNKLGCVFRSSNGKRSQFVKHMKQRRFIPAARWRGNYRSPWPQVSIHSYFNTRHETSHRFEHLMSINNDEIIVVNEDIVVVNDDTTEASSLSHASTVSTATTGSSVTPLPAPLIQQPRVSPPRTVHLVPHPVPYAQLCFDPQQNTLRTLLVGKPRVSKYTPVLDEYPDLTGVVSSQSSSVDSSTGWSSDSSSSSSSSGDTSWRCSSPQEIVWLDKAWLYDHGSDYSDTHRALLHDSESSTDDTSSTGCGKKFLRSVSLCKLKSQHRVQPSGSPKYSPNKLELKRFSLGKHCRYMTLD